MIVYHCGWAKLETVEKRSLNPPYRGESGMRMRRSCMGNQGFKSGYGGIVNVK